MNYCYNIGPTGPTKVLNVHVVSLMQFGVCKLCLALFLENPKMTEKDFNLEKTHFFLLFFILSCMR